MASSKDLPTTIDAAFNGPEDRLPRLFNELVSLARQNGWDVDLYEQEPPDSSSHEMICFLKDYRLYCDYERDTETRRWKFRIAYVAKRPHRMADEQWKKQWCPDLPLCVNINRQGVVWCIENQNEIERELAADLDPVRQDVNDTLLLNYSLSIIDWISETGGLPDAGADEEDERVLGGMLRSIRARVLGLAKAA